MDTTEIDVQTVIGISQGWERMGTLVHEQLERVMEEPCPEALDELIESGVLSPGALIPFRDWLVALGAFGFANARDTAEMITDYLRSREG